MILQNLIFFTKKKSKGRVFLPKSPLNPLVRYQLLEKTFVSFLTNPATRSC